jgi:GxxExxY protein
LRRKQETEEIQKGRKGSLGLIFDDLSNRVIGAAVEVHKSLGPGFIESVYEQALKVELARRGIEFEFQKQIEIRYCDKVVGIHVLDLMVEGKLIVELKAARTLDDIHFAQLRSYLKATNLEVGLLMNFNSPTLVVKRVTVPKTLS